MPTPKSAPKSTRRPAPVLLRALIDALLHDYGKPKPPFSRDPFRLILWEQVAYLVPDAQRRLAFKALEDQVGLTAEAILAAPTSKLQEIARLGGAIASPVRAERLRRSAELVRDRWNGDLRAALALPLPKARRALAQFPMIGEPGADKILVFTKTARLLPLDSNALRVLQRVGVAAEAKDYKHSYRQAQEAVAAELPHDHDWLIAAGQLLRHHGQEVCRRNAPDCARCPVQSQCAFGLGKAAGPGSR